MCVCGFYVICVCVVLGLKQEPNSVPSGRGSMPDGPEEKEVGGKKRDYGAWTVQRERPVG